VISVWSASSLIYYQSVNVAMSHSAAFFSIAMLAWSLNRASIEPAAKIPWLLAGVSWGLGVTVRYQLAVFLLPAAWVLARGVLARRPLLAPVTFFMLGALPLLAGQLFAWHSVYGEWLVFSYGVEGESFHWGNPMVLNSLFSPWHGLFYWHPFTAVGLLGLGIWLWRNPRTAGPWAMVFFLICYINAAWWCWWFASAFGNRGYDAALLPLMAGIAWLFVVARGQARTLLWTGAVIFGLWNFYLILLYRSGAISRNEPVTWVEMLKASSRLGAALKF
jgi:hypothetical protein